MKKQTIFMLGLVLALAILLVGASSVFAQEDGCTECHNSSGTISAKGAGWQASGHGSGEAYIEEYGRNSCAFCHSGNAFSAAVAAGQNFSQLEVGAPEPARQDCYTCHQIHETYTGADWALETSDPVVMVTSGATFDGGSGNLCANCHQARRYLANFAAKDASGNVIADQYTTGRRFNTHYSVQADVLVGAGDFGVVGEPGAHYAMVQDTCVGCHMSGETANHSNDPQLTTCQACHADAESFDVNGYLTAFEEKYAELEAALVDKGMLTVNEDGTTSGVEGTYATGPAQALFFYNLVHEDGSEGIHNPAYFTALLENALAALGE
ncbi:MAG: hypothetical protein FJ010_04480 [Chloroflexi bacterium]|nr:hypothetical protein [Chloroflexota bacterium]